MTSFETSVVIVSPVETVFAYITNINNNANWQKILVHAATTNGDILDVGATYSYTVRFMGKTIETEAVVTAFERNRLFSAKSLRGPVMGEFHLTFEPAAAGTALTTRCRAELGFFRFIGPLAIRFAKEQYRRDLNALKAILEAPTDR